MSENKEINKKESIGKTIFGIFFVLFCLMLSLFFTYECVKYYNEGFMFEHRIVIITSVFSFLCVLACFIFVSRIFKKEFIYKLLLSFLVIYLVCVSVFYIFLKTGFLEKVDSVASLRAYVSSAGKWAVFVYIFVQFLQVVVLPIPSFITTVAGIAMFGPLKCAVFSVIGIVLGSLVAFIIGRYLGYKFAAWLVGKDDLDKWLQKVKGKDKIILTAMFLLPLFPDDILCFVAGLSTMSFAYFAIMIVASRIVSITLTCYAVEGNIIPYNTWWGITIWIVLAILVVIGFIYIYKNGEKIENYFKKKFHKKS